MNDTVEYPSIPAANGRGAEILFAGVCAGRGIMALIRVDGITCMYDRGTLDYLVPGGTDWFEGVDGHWMTRMPSGVYGFLDPRTGRANYQELQSGLKIPLIVCDPADLGFAFANLEGKVNENVLCVNPETRSVPRQQVARGFHHTQALLASLSLAQGGNIRSQDAKDFDSVLGGTRSWLTKLRGGLWKILDGAQIVKVPLYLVNAGLKILDSYPEGGVAGVASRQTLEGCNALTLQLTQCVNDILDAAIGQPERKF